MGMQLSALNLLGLELEKTVANLRGLEDLRIVGEPCDRQPGSSAFTDALDKPVASDPFILSSATG